MKITIEPTAAIIELEGPNGGRVEARVWEGTTDKGTPVTLYVTRVQVDLKHDQAEFSSVLQTKRMPQAFGAVIPLRFVL